MSDLELRADCSRCAALCCLMLAFDRGPSFAIDKPAGVPCPNLAGHGCSIHDALERRGFAGCTRYDCLGAGQIVVQQVFAGRSWRDEPDLVAPMTRAFALLREVQDLRGQLAAARRLGLPPGAETLCDRLEAQLASGWDAERLRAFDLAGVRAEHARLVALLRAAMAGARRPLTAAPRGAADAPATGGGGNDRPRRGRGPGRLTPVRPAAARGQGQTGEPE